MEENISKAIETLSEKLGKTAKEIFGYYVINAKLQKLYYWMYLGVGTLFFLLGVWLFDTSYNQIFLENQPSALQWVAVAVGILFGLIGVIVVIVQALSFEILINSTKNPEYEAFSDLMRDLKNE